MRASKGTAHLAGVLYLLLALGGVYSLKIVPGALIVAADAGATARNIAAHEFTYRLGIYVGLVSEVLFLFLGLTLYALLKDAGKGHARTMLTLVAIVAILGVANFSIQAAPLVLLSGSGYLSAIPKPQLDALALGFLRLYDIGNELAMVFWGLWLLPFGMLVIRSGFFPRVLGWLLIINGFAWVVVGGASFLLPAQAHAVDQVMMPLYSIGEPVVILWLLVKGANVPPLEPAAAA